MTKTKETGLVVRSKKFPGDRGNFDWEAQFDLTDGYLGLTQDQGDPNGLQRVLLSPGQKRALLAFLKEQT